MKSKLVTLALVMAMFFAAEVTGPAQAKTLLGDYLKEKDIEVELSGSMDFYSRYIWRGIRLDNDYVLQPGFNVSAYGFDVGVWGSFDIDNDDGAASDEFDTTISYSHDFEGLTIGETELETISVSAGHIYYDFPGGNVFSKEVFLGVGYDTLLAPTLTWYHDYSRESQGGGDGEYVVLDLSHSFDLNEEYGITLDLGTHVGYNHKLFINGEGGDWAISAGVTVPLTENLSMSPGINYSVPFGGLEDANDGNYEDEFFWGVGLAYNF